MLLQNNLKKMTTSTTLSVPSTQNSSKLKDRLKGKISILALALLLSAFFFSFSSCKKTLQSFRMLGTWEIENYYVDGNDQTAAFKAFWVDYKIMFDVAGNYIETATVGGVPLTVAGTWKVSDDGNSFELTNQADETKRNFNIIEVKSGKAKISEGNKEYHMNKI
jgi:hypothetical protein